MTKFQAYIVIVLDAFILSKLNYYTNFPEVLVCCLVLGGCTGEIIVPKK